MDPSETTDLSNTDFADHMRERRDGRPMLSFVWEGESRLYAWSMDKLGNPHEVRMEKPIYQSMFDAVHAIPGITVHEVTGEPNHNGNAWNLRIEYSARESREFERLVL